MAFNYERSVTTAKRLIKNFGQKGFLRKPGKKSGTAFNPTIGSSNDFPIVVVDLNREVRDSVGTLVVKTQRTLLVSTEGLSLVTPDKADTVMMGPTGFVEDMTEHKIDEIRPLSPGGTVVLYEIDLVK